MWPCFILLASSHWFGSSGCSPVFLSERGLIEPCLAQIAAGVIIIHDMRCVHVGNMAWRSSCAPGMAFWAASASVVAVEQ